MSKTGIGAAVAFTGNISFAARWLGIRGIRQGIETLDDTALDSTNFKEKCPSDLKDLDPIELEVYWDYLLDLPPIGTTGTMTITFPTQGASTAGTITGSAFLVDFSMPDLTTDDTQLTGTITVQFDGKTEPAFTQAVA